MDLYGSIIRPLAFQFDPEWVHERAMAAIESGVLRARTFADPRLRVTAMGIEFANPVGLAAGFDKNARALNHWHKLGFGHIEAGTITHRGQSGNDRPRLFRLPEDHGIINRMGFNNDGSTAVAARIANTSPRLPLGINIGKSKVTELADAPADYQASFRDLHRMGDYFVVNVSSPNTPNLRQLQDKSALAEIFAALAEVDAVKPRLVKVAPDLTPEVLDDVLQVAVDAGIAGIIATNTTISRPESLRGANRAETGGLSGVPVRELADAALAHLGRHAPAEMTLIGVGGIENAEDVWRKITLGAHLTQIYTGWVYGGPHLIPQILEDLAARMDRAGVQSLTEIHRSAIK